MSVGIFQYRIKYCTMYDCVLGYAVGEMGDRDVSAYMEEIALTAKNYGSARVFHDFRQVTLTLGTGEIYFLPAKARGHGFSSRKRALLCSTRDENLSFLETSFYDAGQALQVFDDISAALEWLSVSPDSPCPVSCLADEPGVCFMKQIISLSSDSGTVGYNHPVAS